MSLTLLNMKDRIRSLMETQHMNQQSFASFIGVSPATLSSIYNGRTQPTLNIANRICSKLTNVSLSWLLYGTGEMYRSADAPDLSSLPPLSQSAGTQGSPTSPAPSSSAAHADNAMLGFQFDDTQRPPQSPRTAAPTTGQLLNRLPLSSPQPQSVVVKKIDKPQRRISEIRVFYDDQTWETFVPKR